MLINESRTTAIVLQFPVKRRANTVPASGTANVAHRHDWHGPTIDCAGAWYHEAAMRDAERARK